MTQDSIILTELMPDGLACRAIFVPKDNVDSLDYLVRTAAENHILPNDGEVISVSNTDEFLGILINYSLEETELYEGLP